MAIISLPDDVLQSLRNGEILFTDLDEYGVEAHATRVEAPQRKQNIPQSLRWEVFERDNFTCRASGCASRRMLEADHIVPESKGGTTTLDNLQTLCARHNREKGDRI